MLLCLKGRRMESIELSKRFSYGDESVNSNEAIGGFGRGGVEDKWFICFVFRFYSHVIFAYSSHLFLPYILYVTL